MTFIVRVSLQKLTRRTRGHSLTVVKIGGMHLIEYNLRQIFKNFISRAQEPTLENNLYL